MYCYFVQLSNNNILISGGYSGISFPKVHDNIFIYDAEQNKLYRLNNKMKHRRSNHSTRLLNDGNVLFLGLEQKYIEIFKIK